MDFSFLNHINYAAVAASSIIFFAIGSLWFSTLFSSLWVEELQQHNITIKKPTTKVLAIKMWLTFSANILASIAMAYLVLVTGSTTVQSGLHLGIIVAFGFAVPTLASVFVWENRSLKLFLIDVGYPVVGIIATAVLLSVWH